MTTRVASLTKRVGSPGKTWLVLRNEIVTQVSRTSWILVTFGLPLVVAAVMLVPPLLRRGSPTTPGATSTPAVNNVVEGYVDQSGLVKALYGNAAELLRAYPDESAARKALAAGEIAAYYVVPADYAETGHFTYVLPDPKAFNLDGQSWVMSWALAANLVGGDVDLAAQLKYPAVVTPRPLSTQTSPDVGEGWAYWIPYSVAMILYVMIIMSSSLLRSSMGDERKNRILEILMTSITPRELLTGKIIALAIVGLIQTAVWAGTGYLLVKFSGTVMNLPPATTVPISLVLWSLLFFLLGYGVYATLLAGLGVLTGPNVPGSSSADFVIIWPMVIPIFFMTIIIPNANGLAAVALSMFPPTAPIAMITRLAVGGIPWWQPVVSAALMALTVTLVLKAVSRAFRAQVMLGGESMTSRRYFALLLGRE